MFQRTRKLLAPPFSSILSTTLPTRTPPRRLVLPRLEVVCAIGSSIAIGLKQPPKPKKTRHSSVDPTRNAGCRPSTTNSLSKTARPLPAPTEPGRPLTCASSGCHLATLGDTSIRSAPLAAFFSSLLNSASAPPPITSAAIAVAHRTIVLRPAIKSANLDVLTSPQPRLWPVPLHPAHRRGRIPAPTESILTFVSLLRPA
jgi:hypothetical protein